MRRERFHVCRAAWRHRHHGGRGPASAAERAAELVPNARCELVTDAGNWPQLEQPEAFNATYLAGLRSV